MSLNEAKMDQRLGSALGLKRSITLSDAALSPVAAKTLLIWREEDPFVELKSLQRSGHLPWLDEPVEVASMIADFLSECREEATPKAGTVPRVR